MSDDKQYKILYIEDNPANIRLVERVLSRKDYIELVTEEVPQNGIDRALEIVPDLILLDISMPGMDGFEVLEVLKSKEVLNGVPVIAVTANAMPKDVERGKAAGFVEYVTKPLDIPNFYSIIDQYLGV